MFLEVIGSDDEGIDDFAALNLTVESAQPGTEAVWIPVQNRRHEKSILVFLLPQLPMNEERDVSIRWQWPNMWRKIAERRPDFWLEMVKSADNLVPLVECTIRIHPDLPEVRLTNRSSVRGEASKRIDTDVYRRYGLHMKNVPRDSHINIGLDVLDAEE